MFNSKRRHGTFEITTEQNILIVDAQGPFNRELIQDYQQALTTAINKFNDKPWRQIVIMREESIFTPEALEQMYATIQYRKSKGLIFCAVVFIHSTARSLIEHQLGQVYKSANINFEFFDDYQLAKEKIMQIETSVSEE